MTTDPNRLPERREMLERLEGIKAAWRNCLAGDKTAMDDLSAFGATCESGETTVVSIALPNGCAKVHLSADPDCMDELIASARHMYAPATGGPVRGGYDSPHFKPRPEDQRAINWTPSHTPMVAMITDKPEPMNAPQAGTMEAVAARLAHDVAEALSPIELADVVARNAALRFKNKLGWRCAASKYVDLVGLTELAWKAVTGELCNFADPEQAGMYDDAFMIARDSDYDARFVHKLALTA